MARTHSIAAETDSDPFIEALRKTLKIDYGKDGYALAWSYDGRDYSLDVPHDRFAFYGPGDRFRKDTPPPTTARAQNWEAAGNLLQQLAGECGAQLAGGIGADTLSIYPAQRQADAAGSGGTMLVVFGMALAASLAAWLLFSGFTVLDAVAAAGAGVLLCTAVRRMSATEVKQGIGVWGIALTVAAPAAAVAATGQTWAPLAFVLPFVAAIELEWRSADGPIVAWFLAGLAGLAPLLVVGGAGWAAVGLLAIFLWVFQVLSPIRFARMQILAFTVGAAIAVVLAAGWGDTLKVVGGTPLLPAAAATALAAGAGVLSAASVIFRVLRGSMFLVLPWAMLIATLITALFALIGDHPGAAAVAFAMSGYLLFYVEDCTMWVFRSSQKRIIKG